MIRHKGPAGKGFPAGGTEGQILAKNSNTDYDAEWVNPPDGTDAVNGPASVTNNHVAVFDGTSGKLLKSGGHPLSHYATASSVANKVDKVAGKGLSSNNYTNAEKALLGRIWNTSGYRGVFGSVEDIAAYTFTPAAAAGNYCIIEAEGEDPQLVIWDATNNVWFVLDFTIPEIVGSDIATALFKTDETWDKETCRVFTSTEKAQIAAFQTILESSGLAGAATKAYGALHYFDLTGTEITITGTSDGTTHTTKVDVVSTLGTNAQNFDNGGDDDGTLRYTGTASTTFRVSAQITLDGATTGDFVVGFAKNGTLLTEGRALVAINSNNDAECVNLEAIVTLLNNEYITLKIGRTAGSLDPTIHSMSITATKIP